MPVPCGRSSVALEVLRWWAVPCASDPRSGVALARHESPHGAQRARGGLLQCAFECPVFGGDDCAKPRLLLDGGRHRSSSTFVPMAARGSGGPSLRSVDAALSRLRAAPPFEGSDARERDPPQDSLGMAVRRTIARVVPLVLFYRVSGPDATHSHRLPRCVLFGSVSVLRAGSVRVLCSPPISSRAPPALWFGSCPRRCASRRSVGLLSFASPPLPSSAFQRCLRHLRSQCVGSASLRCACALWRRPPFRCLLRCGASRGPGLCVVGGRSSRRAPLRPGSCTVLVLAPIVLPVRRLPWVEWLPSGLCPCRSVSVTPHSFSDSFLGRPAFRPGARSALDHAARRGSTPVRSCCICVGLSRRTRSCPRLRWVVPLVWPRVRVTAPG